MWTNFFTKSNMLYKTVPIAFEKIYKVEFIDVLWRPKTLGIHFVARLFQKITKTPGVFGNFSFLSNKLVKIIWEQNECLP